MNISTFIEILNEHEIVYSATDYTLCNLYKYIPEPSLEIYLLHFKEDIHYLCDVLQKYGEVRYIDPHHYQFCRVNTFVELIDVEQEEGSCWDEGYDLFEEPLETFLYGCKGPRKSHAYIYIKEDDISLIYSYAFYIFIGCVFLYKNNIL